MAIPEKQAVRAFLDAHPQTTEGELISAFLEEKRAIQKEASNQALPGITPRIRPADQVALKTWLKDGQSDGNVQAETMQLAAALNADDFGAVSLNVWQLAKAALKAFEINIPVLPPTPQV
jgi:hypothetical protein